ncbi:hypothetical protein JOC59_000833 [Weissella beninensis]|uniref:Uncharacterized protein n=2 Tax=Periweissella beninensis TaxID=504936 RepID=A0ABT0VJB8_9LACO|nr:hypothetical protein [Periweissella beninensis]MBM7544118.1 hypothetical protein [Periweissella beninensis]MCM2437509.1 hypothetical protein [Periweissella beninensis]MCT4396563.1 hypothetical protein [Periweissella beninensis]
MFVIYGTKLLTNHLKTPKDAAIPANTTNIISWHADFFTQNNTYYYILVNDNNQAETIAISNDTPLSNSQLAQTAATRIARFYVQTSNKEAFDFFQAHAQEILILADTNQANFEIMQAKKKTVRAQLRQQHKQTAHPTPTQKQIVTSKVDKNARKFYGGLLTHAVHKNTKGK